MVNFAPYVYTYPVVGPGIVLDSCDIYALGNPKRKAAIFCEQVPNQIVVRNCRGLCDLPVVRVSDKLDLETYFDNAEQRRACLRFLIGEENVEVFDANRELPEPMRPYQANRVVADARRRAATGIAGRSSGTATPKGGGRPADSSRPPLPAIRNRSAGRASSRASLERGVRFTQTLPRRHRRSSPNDKEASRTTAVRESATAAREISAPSSATSGIRALADGRRAGQPVAGRRPALPVRREVRPRDEPAGAKTCG